MRQNTMSRGVAVLKAALPAKIPRLIATVDSVEDQIDLWGFA